MIFKDSIVKENKRRNELLDEPYFPLVGIGSPIKRREVFFREFKTPLFLPIEMIKTGWIRFVMKFGSLEAAAKKLNQPLDSLIAAFINERFRHDFEFWAATTVKIKPKEGGDYIPFVLNRPQRKMHEITYRQIVNEEPIREILLKSRQFGGSTYIQVFMAYIQIIHKTNWNSLVAAHLNQAAKNVRFMLSTLEKYYPSDIDSSFTLKSFESTANIKYIPERQCKITVGSIETPDSIRADDVAMGHLTEIGLWKKTDGKSPEDLCQSILGTIPTEPWSLYVLESTAKGVGNFFNVSWDNAVAGKNGLTPVFIPWHEDPKNRMKFRHAKERAKLIRTMTEYEEFLWKCGATLEGIKFYRFKLAEMNGNTWRMKSEFPTTSVEAFQSTGQKVFSPAYLEAIKQDCMPPVWRGDTFADARTGEKSLKNIRFDETNEGNLSIWVMPDTDEQIDNRYCAFADIGGRTEKADYSVIKIIDRYWMMEGGDPEVVAVWYGHLDQDLFAWKCAQLCSFYNDALLAIEVNSLNKEETEGDHFLTILDEIAPFYRNLYLRNDLEKVGDGFVPRYGFHTNVKSRSLILNSLNAAMRERHLKDIGQKEKFCYIERDIRAYNEMSWFVTKPGGKQAAEEGKHDDHVIVTAGSVWLATSEMNLPTKRNSVRRNRKRKPRSEASF